jgi:hypothetical protein
MIEIKKYILNVILAILASCILMSCGNNSNKCTGKGNCEVCTDCSRCKHCNEGEGMCGVCGDGEDEYFEP